jgi:hypothetical protein
MTPAIASSERLHEASAVLEWLRERLSDEEREHLALELLDVARGTEGFRHLLGTWALTVAVREHADYGPQVNEYRNLEASGNLFAGTPLAGGSLLEFPAAALG